MRLISILFVLSLFISCANESNQNLHKLSLLNQGIPLTIKAPNNATVKKSDLGIFTDVTITAGDKFALQLLVSDATDLNAKNVKTALLSDIEQSRYFSKIVEDYPEGFIYEKQIDSTHTNYSFRHVKVQGDREYIFQTALVGTFTEDDVRAMYEAVR